MFLVGYFVSGTACFDYAKRTIIKQTFTNCLKKRSKDTQLINSKTKTILINDIKA
jgi:hypothetical protein